MTDIPETKYVRSGDADLAYQVFGSGADLVAIHGLPGHLEVMWELPEYAAFLDRLGTFGRVIMFDKRGTGMSDRLPGVPAVEQHMEDLIAVMDAAGSSRASVAGWADGAFMAAMLAATYPERVSALILCGLWLKALTGGRRPGLVADPDAVEDAVGPVRGGMAAGAGRAGAGAVLHRRRAFPGLVAADGEILGHPDRGRGAAALGASR